MELLSYIFWDPDDTLLRIGSFGIRYYSLCWLAGLAGAYFMVKWLYRDQQIKESLFEPLFLYCFISILVGARLGHCLFYDPAYYLSSWDISWRCSFLCVTLPTARGNSRGMRDWQATVVPSALSSACGYIAAT